MLEAHSRDELVFLPLGGSGEIGMNFNAYGFGPPSRRKWIVLDCGVLFGRETTTPGVDVIMPDIRYLAERSDDVLAIVATHAHEDHIGAIGLLWPMLKCPIYATPFTAVLIEGKLEEQGLRDRVRVKQVPLGGSLKLGPFQLDFISITHSIPEPNLVAIRTPLGLIAHTGDWKIDPEPLLGEVTDAASIEKLGDEGVLALVCDSTNALQQGHSGSEARVRDSLIQLVGTLKGRVAVTAFASNVARLSSIAEAARQSGRQIALVAAQCTRWCRRRATPAISRIFPRYWTISMLRNCSRAGCSIWSPAARASRAPPWPASPRAIIQCPSGQGRCGDIFQRIHSRQRTSDLRTAQQAFHAGRPSPHRTGSFRPCLRPSGAGRTSPDVSLDPATHCCAGAWRDAAYGRACPPGQIAAGARSFGATERPALPPGARPRRAD